MTTLATILLGAALAAEETEFDESVVTPGVLGFVVTALFAVAVILLGADLVRRIRRNQYRAEIQEELAAEIAERDAAENGAAGGGAPAEVSGASEPGDADEDRPGPARPAPGGTES